MNTGTVGLATSVLTVEEKKKTIVMKKIAMATCCQNQY